MTCGLSVGRNSWSAQRLLSQLQVWLQARHRGVLALELEWTLDLRRLNGVKLPSHERLTVRTAQPTQDIAHLRRLVGAAYWESGRFDRALALAAADGLVVLGPDDRVSAV